MNKNDLAVNIENIGDYIYIIRGHKVMLDADLAILYGVETKNLNKAVNRNKDRFPTDFAFQLTKEEWNFLRFQFGTLNINSLRSQNVILKTGSGKHRKYLPYAFTEQGVAMLSSALHSRQAIKINVEIMRAFVKLRHAISSHEKLSKEMEELRSFILKHSHKNDQEFRRVWDMFKKLMTPAIGPEQKKNELRIGFNLS